MKPRNFPARKLKRQMVAKGLQISSPESQKLLEDARNTRTKKSR